jgi:hypothetical protein
MKKTIAILLVLVIGMVGVFAATDPSPAKLFLTTTVPAINQMAVISAADTEFEWSEITTLDGGMTSIYGDLASAFPVTSALEATAGKIAVLKARSNNRAGVELTLDATGLASVESSTVDSENIDYTVTVGGATISFVDGGKNVTYAGIGNLAYNDAVATGSWDVMLQLNESLASAAADTYTGNLTFTFEAN